MRGESFTETLRTIREQTAAFLKSMDHQPVDVKPCEWWKKHGICLRAKGMSIPEYRRTGKLQVGMQAAEDKEIALWEMLNEDPWFELRGCAMRPDPDKQYFPKAQFNAKVKALPQAEELHEPLSVGGIQERFEEAVNALLSRSEYDAAVEKAMHAADLRLPVARALVALASARTFEKTGIPPVIDFDPLLRTQLVGLLADRVAKPIAGVFSWATNALSSVASALATEPLRNRRGCLMDAVSPVTGDVLLYQADGRPIRDFIADTIADLPKPVILLAHSLGGIACVELLIEREAPNVSLLVTVGSQAPFLYEIGALRTLPYSTYLPEHFPPWLNIYDPRDFLSFVGAGVFPCKPGEPPRIHDKPVNNRLPFPESHSGYWSNPETWNTLFTHLWSL